MAFSNLTVRDRDDLKYFGFVVKEKIGQGTFSKVYMTSYNPNLNPESDALRRTSSLKYCENMFSRMKTSRKQLACKVIEKSYKMPKDYPHRFIQRELNIVVQLSHPYIPCVQAILRKGPKFMIFMSCATRGSLCDRLVSKGPVREKVAVRWTRQLCKALIYLHTLAIAHRDISCDNILITGGYNVKLTDFSYSCFNVTLRGWPKYLHTHCGSMPYVAPEVIRGIPYNPKYSDVWSLGVVMFTMLNGTFPFTSQSYVQQYRDQMERNYHFKQQVLKAISAEAVEKVAEVLDPCPLLRISLQEIVESQWMCQFSVSPKVLKREAGAQQLADNCKEGMELLRGKSKYSVQHSWIKIEKESYFERISNLRKRYAMKRKDRGESELHFHYRNTARSALSVARQPKGEDQPKLGNTQLTATSSESNLNTISQESPPKNKEPAVGACVLS